MHYLFKTNVATLFKFAVIFIRKSKRKVVSLHATNAHAGMDVQLHSLLNTVLEGEELSSSRPDRFALGERVPVPFGLETGCAPISLGPSEEG
jgi:hypothetical protein